jgi:hypothetical protein
LDWQALVHVISAELLPQRAQIFSVKPASILLKARVVPIFERDCSYLI